MSFRFPAITPTARGGRLLVVRCKTSLQNAARCWFGYFQASASMVVERVASTRICELRSASSGIQLFMVPNLWLIYLAEFRYYPYCPFRHSWRCWQRSHTSSGHSMNQSMVQQFTIEGNMRRRVRNASPKGDMHSTMWILALTRLMYCRWFKSRRRNEMCFNNLYRFPRQRALFFPLS